MIGQKTKNGLHNFKFKCNAFLDFYFQIQQQEVSSKQHSKYIERNMKK